MSRPRVTIIGCGNWGKRVAAAVKNLHGVDLHAIYDANITSSGAEYRAYDLGCRWNAKLDEALDGATAAVIATPPMSGRYAHVKACIDAGVTHIRIEKPVALDPAEARRILDDFGHLAHIVVGQTTLWNTAVPFLHGFIDGLWPEAFVSVHARRLSTVAPAHQATPFQDLAPHDIALMIDLFGKPEHAETDGRATRLTWPGVRAVLEHTFDADAKQRTLTIEADTVRLEFDEIEGTVHTWRDTVAPCKAYRFDPAGALDRELAAWFAGRGTPLALGVDVVDVMAHARPLEIAA